MKLSLARRAFATAALLALAAAASAAPPDFGPMRNYQIAFIRRGPTWTQERTPHTDSLQAGHMKNIGRMADAGKLIAAGPFIGDQPLRGIYLFTADSAEAARMAAEDPAVQSGRLVLDLHPILASSAIGAEYAARKKANPALRDSMIELTFGLIVANDREPDPRTHGALMEKHLWHLRNEMDRGRLRLAGPLLDTGRTRGILVFDADTTEARQAVNRDPMVKEGWVRVELYRWYTADGVIPKN